MIVDRKHTDYHGLFFQDVINGGVVHTSLILVLLLLGIGAKLRKVPGLIAVETRSSY
jgi:CRISPR/Cas system CMR-associated protein Cmr1 (group 7 of RAMP superfamily)